VDLESKRVIIDGESLTLEDVERVAFERAEVSLSEKAVSRIKRSREVVEKLIDRGRVIYGVNTGFGKLSEVRISPDKIEQLQERLILSHSAGVGDPLPEETVRAVLLLKINTLAKGYSGCRFTLVDTLVRMLNQGVHPLIPEKGSVGASGDLAPLAHLALVVIGQGEALYQGRRCPGAEAMRLAGIEPVRLAAKEGLALVNGTQVMTAIGCLALLRAENLVKVADVAGAMSTEALLGTPVAFDERIQRARGFPGQMKSAANLRKLLQDSQIVESHRHCPKVQDAYSLRCMPQVHGASRDAIVHVRSVLEKEINAATDNPLVFVEEEEILSGGNFHGQPVALALDFLATAVSELADISERRIEYLLDPSTSGLPAFLVEEGGLNSGFMIAQVTAASLVSENKILSHPASVDSIPTSANKEDHVSMGTIGARKAQDVLENAEYVLAIELLCASQGIDLRSPLLPGKGTKRALEIIRSKIPPLKSDRVLYSDIQKAKDLITSRELVRGVEEVVGGL